VKLTDLLLGELERESDRSRRVLEQIPPDRHDWKPHDRSMAFGYLAEIVASIPSWISMIIERDELDIKPAGGPTLKKDPMHTSAEYLQVFDKAVADARRALAATSDDFLLQTRWRLLVAGNAVLETTRQEMIRDTINHWAHHRGQMTVYLRLLGAKVPALYGPSADDQRF
jgi:uncharacterized damage-inducible protein DinB